MIRACSGTSRPSVPRAISTVDVAIEKISSRGMA